MIQTHARTRTIALLLATLALSSCDRDGGAPSTAPTTTTSAATSTESSTADAAIPQTRDTMNHAVGLMGRFDFDGAQAEFARIAATPNAPIEAALDHAIATLNQSSEGAQEQALVLLEAILKSKPTGEIAQRAQYCRGLCLLYLGRAKEAQAVLLPVAQARPTDSYACYFAAQSLEQDNEYVMAMQWYDRACVEDSSLKSAQLGVQRCAQRLGNEARANAALAEFEALTLNPRARTAEFKYSRMGPLALAIVELTKASAPPVPAAPRAGPFFAEEHELIVHWPAGEKAAWGNDVEQHAASVDLDGDEKLDIVIARGLAAKAGSSARALVLHARGDGSYDALTEHPLATLAGGSVNSMLFGDINDDGRTDLYCCARGGNRLLLATSEGGFRDATESSKTRGAGENCLDGAMCDLDHDGDLDLFVIYREGANELFINNSDGTFREVARAAGIADAPRNPQSVIVADFDFDRDADIFILNKTLPHQLLLNDRLWHWSEGVAAGVSQAQLDDGAVAAAVVEITGIPLRRLMLATGSYLRLPTRMEQLTLNRSVETAVADVTGDGRADLFLLGADAISMHSDGGREVSRWPVAQGTVRTQLLMLDAVHGASLLALRVGAGPLVREPGAGRGQFVALKLSGRTEASQSMRSNSSGIGTSYAARVGSMWSGGETFRNHTGRGQSLAPVAIGVDAHGQADFVELEWSDGVLQSELDLAAGALHTITETQRQISSCPVIFAFDGQNMRFVTDILGVGGLGYLLAPGVYSEPRPWEVLVLPVNALQPRADDTLSLTLAEPMEESCMLDRVRLRAIDLAQGWDIAPDERLAIGGAAPTGEIVAWRNSWLPQKSDALARVDLIAADVGALDPRFIGRLAQEQVIELEFETAIDAINDPWLVIDGWVEYPYCQTMFAAWQANARYTAPSLQARTRDGVWVDLVAEWGYPAGMPRRMALPIPKSALPAGTSALRMKSTMQIYFDSVRLVAREALPVEAIDLKLTRASLASVGFAQRSTGAQHQPFYDHNRLLPLWDCRFQRGLYTEFGDVRALCEHTDGALVVFGPGEEVALDFASPSHPIAEGATRRYILEVNGWCKDMDLFTRDGETIAPLPLLGATTEAAQTLMRDTRTRPMGGR